VAATPHGPIETHGLLRGNVLRGPDFKPDEIKPRGGPGPKIWQASGWEIATVERDDQIHYYNRGGWEQIIPLEPTALTISKSDQHGPWLVATAKDRSVYTYAIGRYPAEEVCHIASADLGELREVSANDTVLLVVGITGPARVWSLPDCLARGSFPPDPAAIVRTAVASPSGKRVAVEDNSGETRLFDVKTGQSVGIWHAGLLASGISFTPSLHEVLALAQDSGTIVIYQLPNLVLETRLEDSNNRPLRGWFSRNGDKLIVVGSGGFSAWDLKAHKRLAGVKIDEGIGHVSLEESESNIVGAFTQSGKFRLWDIRDGLELPGFKPERKPAPTCIAASSDGNTVAVARKGYSGEL